MIGMHIIYIILGTIHKKMFRRNFSDLLCIRVKQQYNLYEKNLGEFQSPLPRLKSGHMEGPLNYLNTLEI